MDPRRALPSGRPGRRRALRASPPAAGRRRPRSRSTRRGRRSPAAAAVEFDDVVRDAAARVERRRRAFLRPVLNATGVLLHTNLGRAPLGDDALAEAGPSGAPPRTSSTTSTPGSGVPGTATPARCWREACGAEAGLVVNNNAAAVLLTLAALARGHDVVVSRGELVEIGGGFRVPEIMAESGCRLVEVGTTNRTRVDDYAAALDADVALVLKVHASNYRMVGFTEATTVAELARLGPTVMVDAGSGLLDETTPWLPHRPSVVARRARRPPGDRRRRRRRHVLGRQAARRAAGRGDRRAAPTSWRRSRATRSRARPGPTSSRWPRCSRSRSRTSSATRRRSRSGGWRRPPDDALRARAHAIAEALDGAKVVDTEAVAGGGSLPGLGIPSVGVALEPADADRLAAVLRDRDVVARVADGAVVCDLRTVDPVDDRIVARRTAGRGPRRRHVRVVATAGHVDHGKSSLVLALTGTDPDRFAEEKARGLTIDLGFAFTTLAVGHRGRVRRRPRSRAVREEHARRRRRGRRRAVRRRRRRRAGCPRARSTSASSTCSACATGWSRSRRPTR